MTDCRHKKTHPTKEGGHWGDICDECGTVTGNHRLGSPGSYEPAAARTARLSKLNGKR